MEDIEEPPLNRITKESPKFNIPTDVIITIDKPLFNPSEHPDIIQVYKSIQKYCEYKRTIHWRASKYYEINDRKIIIPSICFSTIASVLIYTASTYTENDNQIIKILSITSGALTSVSTLLTTISNSWGLSKKAESHQLAAESFDQLVTKIKFEMIHPKTSDFYNVINNKINEIKQNCKYIVPEWIILQYDEESKNELNDK